MVFESGDEEKWQFSLCCRIKSRAGSCAALQRCLLRVVFIVDSLQLPNVQVSDALQMLEFRLDLCFLLHRSTESYHLPKLLLNFIGSSANPPPGGQLVPF